MNAKISCCCILIACMLFCSCRTCDGHVAQPSNNNQRELGRLEATIESYERAVCKLQESIGNFSDDVGRRAETAEQSVDRIIELFDEYQRTVEQFIRECDKIKADSAAEK